MASIGGERKAAHVLAIPYPTQGHMTPLLRLTTQLAQKGAAVSFVCYEGEIPSLTSASAGSDASSELLGSHRFVTVPKRSEDIQESLEPFIEKLFDDKRAGIPGGPTCIISDAFLTFTLNLAERLEIPRYALVASGVTLVRFMQGVTEYSDSGKFQISEKDGKLVEFDWPVCISGLPPLRFHQLSYLFRNKTALFISMAKTMLQSAGVLVNSFLELEEKVVEEFKGVGSPVDDEHIKVPKIYTVGPLFSTKALTQTKSVSKELEDSSSKCLLWLDSQTASSVLYVAFGSRHRLLPHQILELARGLEASNQTFLWVIPQSKEETPSLTEILPSGFEERVGNRGCIVTGWAPQLQILAHSSTGGFMTHSGWNSSLESVILGVPMISWPQGAEQHLNCRYLVDEMKIAEELQTGKENILKQDEVERVVRLLMLDSKGAALRSRVQELQRKATAAVAEDGSSSKSLEEFLDDICDHHN